MTPPDSGGRVRRFLLGGEQRPVPPQTQDLSALIAQANYEALDQMIRLNNERMEWAGRMQRNLEMGCELIKKLSLIASVIGWVLIVVPFILFFLSTSRDPNLLWFSGIGLAETVGIMVYQPMDRVQKATSDMVESTIILNSWATEVGLTLYLLKLDEIKMDKIAATTILIGNTTQRHVEWLQHYTEKEPTSKAADNRGVQLNSKAPAH